MSYVGGRKHARARALTLVPCRRRCHIYRLVESAFTRPTEQIQITWEFSWSVRVLRLDRRDFQDSRNERWKMLSVPDNLYVFIIHTKSLHKYLKFLEKVLFRKFYFNTSLIFSILINERIFLLFNYYMYLDVSVRCPLKLD